MSNVALGKDKKLHYADCSSDKYSGSYCCPNEACGVPMILKNIGTDAKSRKMIDPYFLHSPIEVILMVATMQTTVFLKVG
jgi:hypothetical protein